MVLARPVAHAVRRVSTMTSTGLRPSRVARIALSARLPMALAVEPRTLAPKPNVLQEKADMPGRRDANGARRASSPPNTVVHTARSALKARLRAVRGVQVSRTVKTCAALENTVFILARNARPAATSVGVVPRGWRSVISVLLAKVPRRRAARLSMSARVAREESMVLRLTARNARKANTLRS